MINSKFKNDIDAAAGGGSEMEWSFGGMGVGAMISHRIKLLNSDLEHFSGASFEKCKN